jgi:hypothetical protein
VSFSLCHSRGGNLQDEAVCDTPALGVENWPCDVMKNTLTVDWQGKVHICEHDLHGAYELGDLMTEPLEVVLERRELLLKDSTALEICKGLQRRHEGRGTPPLASLNGGLFRDWVYYLFKDMDDPISEMNDVMKWIIRIYEKEGSTDRFVNRFSRSRRRPSTRRAGEAGEGARGARSPFRRTATLSARRGSHPAPARRARPAVRRAPRRLVAMRRDPLWRFASMIRNDLQADPGQNEGNLGRHSDRHGAGPGRHGAESLMWRPPFRSSMTQTGLGSSLRSGSAASLMQMLLPLHGGCWARCTHGEQLMLR